MSLGEWISGLRLAPDGKPRPDAPFGRGPFAARMLRGAILGASAVVSRLPGAAIPSLTVVGGTVEWALRPAKRRRLAENLCHTLSLPPDDPEVRALVRREVRNEAQRSADFLWAIAKPGEFLAGTQVEGGEHIDEALALGRGVLLVSTHVGGWEVATALPEAVVPVPTTAIVTDDWLAWAVEGLRIRVGLGIMYDSEPASKAVRLLRAGEALLVLGDYAKDWMRTYPVRLLDAIAELPAGPVTLSRLCGSPIVPFTVLPVASRRWRVEIESALLPPARDGGVKAEKALLQELADRWTRTLREHADHWAAVYPMTWRTP
ncbi:MAG TPA: lysophospholipid acyltransferase family protein [Gaiellaceae bacterium]|nr:lysophospholipid acyltransferase family protein [Gaiellaceae bacterium]